MSQGQFIMVFIIEYIEKISVERMDIFYLGKVIQDID